MKSTSPEADPACTDANVLRRARIALAAVCEPGEAGLADAIDSRGPTATVAALLDGGRQRPLVADLVHYVLFPQQSSRIRGGLRVRALLERQDQVLGLSLQPKTPWSHPLG